MDGFGNRTNQTVTKGSAPSHSVTVDENTNRLHSSSGYGYDDNGNMTTMPLMTMSYDVANRMVSSNHASAGTQTYGYNQANQRVFIRNGSTVTYMLYGLGGERLLEFQETCTASCTGYAENQRWIYFAGRRMFSKTGTTLKAITPNRLASEAKHFPYGETDGTPPSDTKDYFATYRRDGTGLDYAWNRYYSPTMGRFTSADPYSGSINPSNPQSWNRFSYTENNPVNAIDSKGLACSVVQADVYVEDLWNDGRTYRFDYLGFICYGPGLPEAQSGSNSNEPVPESLGPTPTDAELTLERVYQALNRAVEMLGKLPCSLLFRPQLIPTVPAAGFNRRPIEILTPEKLLARIAAGDSSWGKFAAEPLDSSFANVGSRRGWPEHYPDNPGAGFDRYTATPNYATITFDSSPDGIQILGNDYIARIILHELAHVWASNFGAASTDIKYDAPGDPRVDTSQGRINQELITSACK